MASVSKIKGKRYLLVDISNFYGVVQSSEVRPSFEDYENDSLGFELMGKQISLEHAVFISERMSTSANTLDNFIDLFEYFPNDPDWLNAFIKHALEENNELTLFDLLVSVPGPKEIFPFIDKIAINEMEAFNDQLFEDFRMNGDVEAIEDVLKLLKDINVDSEKLKIFLKVIKDYISIETRGKWEENLLCSAIQEVGNATIVLSFAQVPEYLEEIIDDFALLTHKLLRDFALSHEIKNSVRFTSDAILEATSSMGEFAKKYEKYYLDRIADSYSRFFAGTVRFDEIDPAIDMLGLTPEESQDLKTTILDHVSNILFSSYDQGKKISHVGLLFDNPSPQRIRSYEDVITHALIDGKSTAKNIANSIDRSSHKTGEICALICDLYYDDPKKLNAFVSILTDASKINDNRRNQNGASNLNFTNAFFGKLQAMEFDLSSLGEVDRPKLSSYGRVLQAISL